MKRIRMLLGITLSLVVLSGCTMVMPEELPLPNGFQPEGIVVGQGADFFVGSLGRITEDGGSEGGAIYRGNLQTGQGSVIVPAQEGRSALGLEFDPRTNYLFVAGGPFGSAQVYDGASGEAVADYQLVDLPFMSSVVNDVVVTEGAAYFTDSFQPFLYRLPLGADGALPDASEVEGIPLGGEFEHVPGGFNANGIVATADGSNLLVVNTETGSLYRVDPASGDATQIDLGGEALPSGDGLVLDGNTLYVVQNTLNKITVVELEADLSAGTVVDTIVSPLFRIPTSADQYGNALYAVNARFDVAPPPFPGSPPADPELAYEVVRVSK